MTFRTPLAAAALALVALGAQAQTAQPATYAIDPTHTFVTFEVTHFGTSTNRGRFDRKSGSVQLDRAAQRGHVELTLETASINTGTEAFNRHLQSKDFFNVAEFPTARFVADEFTFAGGQPAEVTGQFTLLGKTQPLTLKASRFNCYQNPMLKREVCGGDFEATLTRSAYGMNWGLDYGIPDAVKLVIQVEAIRQD
jgi:polyisoprenoid-binding protein YceI